MTSRKSFSNLIKICLRNNIWSIAVTCIGLFFAMPVYGALYIANIKYRLQMGLFRPEVLPAVFRRSVLGEGNIAVIIAVVIVAIISAIGGFSYLFSKQKVDLYHSLPEKRGTLFTANYIAGFVGFIIPYFVFTVITLILGEACGVLDAIGIKASLIFSFINILGFVGVYTVTVIAVMLTGNAIVSILATGVFMLYGPIVFTLANMLKSRFFLTCSSFSQGNGILKSSIVPMYFELTEGMNGLYGRYDLVASRFIIYILVVAALIAASYFIYGMRPSEAAGKAMAFKKIMPVISVMLLVPAALYGGLAFEAIASGGGHIEYGWLIFGSAVVILIGHFIIQAIYFSDFKSLFKNMINPGVAAGITAIIFVIFICDITGYDSYMPKGNELESAAITTAGLHGNLEYYNFDAECDEYGNRNTWIGTNEYRLNNMNITDSELVYGFVTAALEDTREFQKKLDSDDPNKYDDNASLYFEVRYRLKGGKTVSRSYVLDAAAHLEVLDKLYSSEEYKNGVFNILTMSEDELTDIAVACPLGEIPVKLSKNQMRELVKTYRKELIAHDIYDLKDNVPVGCLYKNYQVDESGSMFYYRVGTSYIYPSFEKTISLLKEYGIDFDKYMSASNVESIIVHNSHYYEDDGVSQYHKEDEQQYTSMEDISAIMEVAYPMEMSDTEPVFRKNAEIEIEVHFRNVPGIYNYGVSYCIPENKVPDFVREDVDYYR